MSVTDVEDHVLRNYEIRRRIGKGAYGIVWKSVDRRTGEIVALKKIFDAFSNATDAQRTYREVMFLQAFASHENVVQLLNVVRATNNVDLYLVFEFMDTDLHAVIKNRLLQPVHHQFIMYQLMKVLKFIHSGNCIHRDLKPSNILINPQCHIKLADFGLARSLSLSPPPSDQQPPDTTAAVMTDYVATRWYRAPEVLLGGQIYTTGVDMWSAGCILAEMIAGKPLFPGSSTMNQIEKVMAVLPLPSRQEIENIRAPYAMAILGHIPRRRAHRLPELLPSASNDALDLLTKLLQFSTERRLSACSAIHHPFIRRFHDASLEPVLECDVALNLDDNKQLPLERYRERLYSAIADHRDRQTLREDGVEPAEATPTQVETTPTSERAKCAQNIPSATQLVNVLTPAINKPHPQLRPHFDSTHPSQPHHSSVQAPDLTVTSARIVPSARPAVNGRLSSRQPHAVARGAPSSVAMGTYTQTHGIISHSNLQRLRNFRS